MPVSEFDPLASVQRKRLLEGALCVVNDRIGIGHASCAEQRDCQPYGTTN